MHGMKREHSSFFEFYCSAAGDKSASLFPSVFPKDLSGHSSSPPLLPQHSYSQNFLWTDGTPYPKHGFFPFLCGWKALLGLALAANPQLRVWSEERMMKEAGFDKREWGLLFSALLGWFFQIPPGSREQPVRADQIPLEILQFLATCTSCYLKILKDFRAGMEQDESFNLQISLTSFFAVVEISVQWRPPSRQHFIWEF